MSEVVEQVVYGASDLGKLYHRLTPRIDRYSGKLRYMDCNSWERVPLDEPPAGKLPCRKCFKSSHPGTEGQS